MKRIFTLFAGLFLAAALNAQPCVPDAQYTTPGIFPDTLINLPPVTIGVAYTGVITAVVPADTSYMGFSATIDSINVIEIVGLPSGFTWSGAPTGVGAPVSIPGGSNGCIAIIGTATAGQTGVYPLKIRVIAYGEAMSMPMSLPDTVNGYKLVIGNVGFGENPYYSFGVTDMYPNPAADVANIVVTNNETSIVAVTISDMVGRTVSASNHKVNAGENTIALNVAALPEGVYFYTIAKGTQSVTRKLIISR
ncbi:hypothetical protein DSECCO2_595330 [anaerobic digester metagenome]